MPQATGKVRNNVRQNVKSTPKLVRVNADDGDAVVYRNLGNGRRLPFIWGQSFVLASGTSEVVVSSGVDFNGHAVANGIVTASPTSAGAAALNWYLSKDTVNNVVKIVNTGGNAAADMPFDVMIMLGVGTNFIYSDSNQIWKREYK